MFAAVQDAVLFIRIDFAQVNFHTSVQCYEPSLQKKKRIQFAKFHIIHTYRAQLENHIYSHAGKISLKKVKFCGSYILLIEKCIFGGVYY